jgi:hypothetical protein
MRIVGRGELEAELESAARAGEGGPRRTASGAG